MGAASVHDDIHSLESIAARLDPFKLPTLTDLFPVLDRLASYAGVPGAFKNQVERVKKMVETTILGEVPLEPTIGKLRELVGKMVKALTESAPNMGPPADAPAKPEEAVSLVVERDMELLKKFANIQSAHLDDFEVYVLEMEKGNPVARDEVRRYLHTLKGEFGVLDLQAYAELVHALEDSLESGALTAEHLLKFKDWLIGVLPPLLVGQVPPVTVEDQAGFGFLARPPVKERAPASQETVLPITQDPSFFADFVTESREHIHVMETRLLDLETDPSVEESLNAVFRACHTIKGLAGFLELGEIQKLAHAMETLMDRARHRQMILNVGHTDLLLSSADCIKDLVLGVEEMLKGGTRTLPASYNDLLRRLASPEMLEPIDCLKVAPTAKVGEILVETGMASVETVDEALALQKAGDQRKLGEILVQEQQVSTRGVGQALGAQTQAKQQAQLQQAIEESVRVPVTRLDQLIDAIGEAVIAQSMIVADSVITDITQPTSMDARDALRRKVARAELVMRQIQELSMSLRMVSVKGVFQKMARLARDLSKKMDKKMDFVMEGENTELDKTVVENIGDPLVHMVRNAIDHGLETAEERASTGKNPVARVVMRAFHKAGSVFIEIEDDGKGLDKGKIIAKAIEQKLIASHDILSDNEVWELIFRPGFSTAAKVTDVSGRGVGMDVVRRNIEALRGSVEITSTPGKGSLFTIRLPLTLAIIDGMVVRTRKERYIVPTLSIHATVKPTQEQLSTVTGKGEMLNLRGELIRLVRLAEVFGNSTGKGFVKEPSGLRVSDGVVLVVEDMLGKKVGLLVDEIMDQQQVVIKNLGAMGDVPGVTGGAIMNDGSVALILDVGGVIKSA
jgi:two-component system, chemotaxis family, sensor kinase CheA